MKGSPLKSCSLVGSTVGGWTDRVVKPVDQRNIKLRRTICLELIIFIPALLPERVNKLRINRGCGQVNIGSAST